jgi:hypothetical protein
MLNEKSKNPQVLRLEKWQECLKCHPEILADMQKCDANVDWPSKIVEIYGTLSKSVLQPSHKVFLTTISLLYPRVCRSTIVIWCDCLARTCMVIIWKCTKAMFPSHATH